MVDENHYCYDFKAAIKWPLQHLQTPQATGAGQRIAGRQQKVAPVLLADCSMFLGE